MSISSYLRLAIVLLFAAAGCPVFLTAGCAQVRLPAIDPSGQRIFSGGSTTLAGPDCPLNTRPAAATIAPPVVVGPAVKPPCNPPVVAVQPIVAVPIVAVPVVAVPVAPIQQPPCGPQGCPTGPQLKVCPAQLVAPVGSEVIVTAGLCGPSGYYVTRQPLEWMLAPDGVGQIVQVGKETNNSFATYFRGTPHKVAPNYVRAHTSTTSQVITRGTPSRMDDVALEKGQSWISVTSPTEGTTSITVWAPAEGNWEKRRQTATILWVDAKWRYPAPAIVRSGAGGRHILTTKVTRGNGAPISDFTVQYEVLEGPEAGFGAAGQKVFNAPHTGGGNYSAELLSKSGQSGVTTVAVRIFRPAQGSFPEMLVGQGLTSITWSSPGLHVQAVGQEVVALGGTVSYQVKVYNSGDVAARDVKLNFTPPSGVTFLNATPSPGTYGQMRQWRLGDLQPGTAAVVDVNCRASMAADIRAKFRAESAEKLVSESNVNTKVFASALSVKSTSPARVNVGQEVKFQVEVTNTGRTPLANVIITDTFDPGLTHKDGEVSPIVKTLGTLAPNQTERFGVTFRVDQPGKLCHRLDVQADGGHSAGTTGCVEAVAAAAAAVPKVSVLVSGPRKLEVGKKGIVRIEIKNGSAAPLTNLRLAASFSGSLSAIQASGGAPLDDEGLSWLIPRLMSGEAVVKEIEFEGAAVDAKAVVKARLTSDQAAVQTSEASINVAAPAITPPRVPGSGLPGAAIEPPANAGNLIVSVAASDEPIGVGMEVTYRIDLQNKSTLSDDDVAITLILPEGMKFKSLSPANTYAMISSSKGRYEIAPIQTIGASEKLTSLDMKTTGEKVGSYKVQVEVRSKRNPKAIVAEVTTRVN
ncbi:MAG: DUF11 domain-containing protein [Pirellulaceae bacterium]|nr:DUF11 domain-containing protein [Pirellulaceae bacterium]